MDQAVEQLAAELQRNDDSRQSLRLAVLDMQDLRGATPVLGRYLSERLTTRLWASSSGYTVIERRRLAQVLDELEFAQSDLVDPTNGRRFGRMAGVDAVIVGTVSVLLDRVEIDARMVDLERTTILAAGRTSLSKNADVRALLAILPEPRKRPPPTPVRAVVGDGDTGTPGGGALAVSPAKPVWSDRGLRVEGSEARRAGDTIRVTVVVTNLTEHYTTVRFARLDPDLRVARYARTYLLDDAGSRYPAVEGSMFRRPYGDGVVELAPGASVQAYLAFTGVAPQARSVTLVNITYLSTMRVGPLSIVDDSS